MRKAIQNKKNFKIVFVVLGLLTVTSCRCDPDDDTEDQTTESDTVQNVQNQKFELATYNK
ncbi:hypothetical protein QFZ37_003455 [Chryseobacterium ginsenosidimutans]|uniref:hypothetical protein n=1 Tax=Chryseobacterium ginsenosidimutans TaxID=687846 RepID=UPI0027820103|nr:hypothetical protein [Chryseobacterium ginsenosidimutans]MDQ0595086.1 hypothetical protein [Chryseobacterium ginsenosidimutans]